MHTIQCQCGQFRAQLVGAGTRNHIRCYCSDCRAFAHFLEKDEQVLDAHGGTEIVQVSQARLQLIQGREHLAAVRLSDKGMLRWYAACCKSPIGNTMPDPKMAFIGLIHTALDRARIDQDFGPVTACFETRSATAEPRPAQKGVLPVILRFMWMMIVARVSGSYKRSPLFDANAQAIVEPQILSEQTLQALKSR